MKITKEEIEYVAQLARLSLSEEQLGAFTGHMGKIIDYVNQLNELDVDNVSPTSQNISFENVLRDDKVDSIFTREQSLSNAPLKEGGFFKVPKVIDEA